MSKRKAFSYLRFSTPEQAAGDSFRRQATMAREYAARHDLDLDTSLTFHDLGVSAYRGTNADTGKLADFLEAVEVGLVPKGSVLLVEALDRLTRLVPRKALRVLESIIERGVDVVTLNDGKLYSIDTIDQNPVDLMIAVVYFMRANEESATKARRLRQAWEGKRQQAGARPLTRMVPGWLRVVDGEGGARERIEVIPERAELLRRIFAEHLAGSGLQVIANRLNAEGVECWGWGKRKGDQWHRSYIKKLIENPATYGSFVPHTWTETGGERVRVAMEPMEGYYPAVVSREEFEQANQRGGRAPHHRSGVVISMLAGLATCPICDNAMTRVNKGRGGKSGTPKLVCSHAKVGGFCHYVGVDQALVEDALMADPARLVADAPAAGDPEVAAQVVNLESAISGIEDAIENVLDAIQRTGASEALATRLRELEADHAEQSGRHAQLLETLAASSGPVIEKRLAALEDALQRHEEVGAQAVNAALRSLVDAVVVDYRWGVLRMQWRHGGESEVRYAWPMYAFE